MSVKSWPAAHRHKGGIIRYLYDKVKALDSASGGDATDIEALETVVGDADSGLVKDVNTLKTTVGDDSTGLVHDVATVASGLETVETAIGSESTEGSILARIKALEDA